MYLLNVNFATAKRFLLPCIRCFQHQKNIQFFVLLILALSISAKAQKNPVVEKDTSKTTKLDEVTITSKMLLVSKIALSTEASAAPASVSVVGKEFIAKQAIQSYGDLIRPIAGVSVSNYQLGGVGYGIQMRGYVVTEHARDIAFFIDGVPQNQSSSIQANGYVDLTPLIAENVKRIEVTRGPFSAFYGDHALGGAISFETDNKVASSLLLSGGSFGAFRGLATVGFGHDDKTGYVSVEGSTTKGYRDNNKQKNINGFAKYSFPFAKGLASIRGQIFSSDFGSAGYLPIADITAGTIKKTSFVNNSDGGTTSQQNIVFNYRGNDSSRFNKATVYFQHHDFVRIRTGVVGGAQRLERDNHTWFGGDFRRTIISSLGKIPALYSFGVSIRTDITDNSRFVTVNRQKVSQNRDRDIIIFNPAVYAQVQLQPVTKLKITLSARYDELLYKIKTGSTDAGLANANLKPQAGAFSPKAGIAYGIAKGVNVFFNAAEGFKSPSGYEENIFNTNLAVSTLTSYELGVGADDAKGRLHGLIAAYISTQNGEIQEDPLGNLINFGKTRRSGVEVEGRAALNAKGNFSVFGNYSKIIAKIQDGGADNIYVTNTPEYIAVFGFDWEFFTDKQSNNRIILSIFDQLTGNRNLNTAGTIKSDAFHRLSSKISFTKKNWANFSAFVQGNSYLGKGDINEVNFLSGGNILTSPQGANSFVVGIKLPFNF